MYSNICSHYDMVLTALHTQTHSDYGQISSLTSLLDLLLELDILFGMSYNQGLGVSFHQFPWKIYTHKFLFQIQKFALLVFLRL